jgi:hypothetical protein
MCAQIRSRHQLSSASEKHLRARPKPQEADLRWASELSFPSCETSTHQGRRVLGTKTTIPDNLCEPARPLRMPNSVRMQDRPSTHTSLGSLVASKVLAPSPALAAQCTRREHLVASSLLLPASCAREPGETVRRLRHAFGRIQDIHFWATKYGQFAQLVRSSDVLKTLGAARRGDRRTARTFAVVNAGLSQLLGPSVARDSPPRGHLRPLLGLVSDILTVCNSQRPRQYRGMLFD